MICAITLQKLAKAIREHVDEKVNEWRAPFDMATTNYMAEYATVARVIQFKQYSLINSFPFSYHCADHTKSYTLEFTTTIIERDHTNHSAYDDGQKVVSFILCNNKKTSTCKQKLGKLQTVRR